MVKLKDSDDGGDSDGDDGDVEETERRKETAGPSSPTSARKKTSKDSVKRPSGTRSAGDADEGPTQVEDASLSLSMPESSG
eukprot:Skav217724  [mRNA]  locus=scaffold308:102789:113360:- [translate_table: standard]